jgi:hypothetical protein
MEIVVHPDPFLSPIIYHWEDVQGVATSCSYGRGGMSVGFRLDMTDGRRIDLGGDSWAMTAKNYRDVTAALAVVPYAYDNRFTGRCPPAFRRLFSKRPS